MFFSSYVFGSIVCDVFLCFVTFPYGALGSVWYLIVLIPALCLLPHFVFTIDGLDKLKDKRSIMLKIPDH